MSPYRVLLPGLVILGVALTFAVVPGVFTIDENNYLASVIGLRNGDLALAGTDQLPPSIELYWFDPWPAGRGAPRVPVVSTAPPLYAPLALPFSLFGYRGLVALNTLSFLVAIWLTFLIARRASERASTAWIAAGTFAFAAPTLGYSLALWPHQLTVALCTAAVASAQAARTRLQPLLAALGAGLLVGLAAGIRYQNAIFAALLGLTLCLWGKARLKAAAGYSLGLMGPFVASAWINHARIGMWSPFSKGPTYTALYAGTGPHGNALTEALHVLWATVVDFSAHPAILGGAAKWQWLPDSLGAFIWQGALKKAWTQSAPWVLLALLLLCWAAWPGSKMQVRARDTLRPFVLIVFGMLGFFALAGFARHDGISFNQRYFLELTPLVTVALALGTESLQWRKTPAVTGALLGLSLLALAIVGEPGAFLRSTLILKAPLLLAALLCFTWVVHHQGRIDSRAPTLVLAACLAWAMGAHLGDDFPASRRMRQYNSDQQEKLAHALPDHAALFAYGGSKDAAGPLLLERDLVIADPLPDDGAAAPALVAAFLDSGRRVFVELNRFPLPLYDRLRQGLDAVAVTRDDPPVVELKRFP